MGGSESAAATFNGSLSGDDANLWKAQATARAHEESHPSTDDAPLGGITLPGRHSSARVALPPAVVSYNIHRQNADLRAFDEATKQEQAALSAGEEMVKAAGDVYSADLPFGVHRAGSPRRWREEFAELQQCLEQLAAKRWEARPLCRADPGWLHHAGMGLDVLRGGNRQGREWPELPRSGDRVSLRDCPRRTSVAASPAIVRRPGLSGS